MTKICLLTLTISVLFSSVLTKPTEQIFSEDDDLQKFSWEHVDLVYLSSVALKPENIAIDYHVINAVFVDTDSKYTLHLNRPHGLFSPKQLKISDEEDKVDLQCNYEGTVNKLTGNGDNVAGGSLSLSSCNRQKYSGLEGLLLLHDAHYYIKPDTVNLTDSKTDMHNAVDVNSTDTQAIKLEQNPTIRHKAFKLSTSNHENFNNYFDETLEVPEEEVKKWVKNETEIFENLLDEEITTKNSIPQAIKKKTFYYTPSNTNIKYSTELINSQKVVEIAFFTDAKLYDKWGQRFPRDTSAKLRQYVLAVVNNMNALYNQPSMTEKIAFRLVHIEIATSQYKNLNTHNGQAVNFLRSFCSYAAKKNLKGTLWDHALLLTGVDLQENNNFVTAGITWHSTMCVNGLSCSVIEGSSFLSAFVSSHEIGHSLGMEHDGATKNSDCNSETSIMSPTTGGGRTTWSKCSMRNLQQFLVEGYIGFNPPKCLTKKSSRPNTGINYIGNKMPGQQYPAEVQCSIFCKNKCVPYITDRAPYNNICYLLHCQQEQGQKTIVEAIHPALEGTPCDGGKVCFQGRCQNVMKNNPYLTGLLI